MTTGGTVEELDAEVDALRDAVVLHRSVLQDAEQRAITDPNGTIWQDIAAVQRAIVAEYTEEIRLLGAEIVLIPRQRLSP